MRGFIWQDTANCAQQASVIPAHRFDQGRRWIDGNGPKGHLQLFQGMGSRNHLGYKPLLRTGDCALPQSRNEAGLDGAGLAAAGWADQGQETGIGETVDELLNERFAAEEVVGVGFLEGAQAFIRVVNLGHRGEFFRHCGGDRSRSTGD